MAQKTAAPSPQLVHIHTPGTDNSALSKAQKEFNRLTARIASLEKAVVAFREAATRLRQRVQNEYRPLQAQHNAARAALVRVLDHAHDTYKLTRGEKKQAGGHRGAVRRLARPGPRRPAAHHRQARAAAECSRRSGRR